jgi:glutamate synthase (NADPH) small chain
MADPKGFITTPRKLAERRPVAERVHDWQEVYPGSPGRALLPIIEKQSGRCMDCGIPFCHSACPLGNLIPEWNDLLWRDDWTGAIERLHATNNFPEFTGRLCPAPCEAACVVGIHRDPVTIKNIEVALIDRAWDDRRVVAVPAAYHTGKTVAVIGSGPSGLAVSQQLTRAGYTVVVYERADAAGGLLRYGIPEFKMQKSVLNRRLKQMRLEGTAFKTGVNIGVDITGPKLLEMFDAVVVATGSTVPRDLPVPGRQFGGIHQAMEYLPQANRIAVGQEVPDQIVATDKDVVIIGGGDTGADCLGTALRQGAKSVTQLEIMPMPPQSRPAAQPWPTFPMTFKVTSAHEEGGDRVYSVSTAEFLSDENGNVCALVVNDVKFVNGKLETVPDTTRTIPAQLVLLAMGFVGPQRDGLIEQLGLELDARGNIVRDENFATNVDRVFACGDAGRGQSLIVWAIAEGRSCATGVDSLLAKRPSRLPKPILPTDRPLRV